MARGQANLAVAENSHDAVGELIAAHQHEQDKDENEAADTEEFDVRPGNRAELVLKRRMSDNFDFLNGTRSSRSPASGSPVPESALTDLDTVGFSIFAVTSAANRFRRPTADSSPGSIKLLILVSICF